jgi:hypothetical protein
MKFLRRTFGHAVSLRREFDLRQKFDPLITPMKAKNRSQEQRKPGTGICSDPGPLEIRVYSRD